MSCLNCNKETSGTAVFCEDCLREMEQHPVAKGTPATIPAQPSPAPQKKQNHELFGSLEENLSISRRAARRMGCALSIMTFLVLMWGGLLAYIIFVGMPDFLNNIHLPW